ncbi:MAG: hypothetical protein HFH17_01270 [Ruminococcus sp.]|nr:hypothetical protein [Ruminococcus sp.]
MFSFLDLLEITQKQEHAEEVIDLIADKVSELTIKIETERSMVEHIVLPTYRYIEQLLDMYASPESLALSYNKKYILAEVLSKLGEKMNAELVLVDLRAGLSEFSAPLLFDPRVKKFLVTSTSYQSVKGTEILLHQLSKGLPLNENSKIPEILLTMGQENINTTDIVSGLTAVYDKYVSEGNVSITDDQLTRDDVIKRIHSFAEKQITAEGNGALKVLMTDPVQNLIRKYKNSIPNTVIMGAKGSGKTFLYREILRNQFWEKFIINMDKQNSGGTEMYPSSVLTVPLLASGNAGEFYEILENTIQNYNRFYLKGKIQNSVYLDNRDVLLQHIRKEYDPLQWKDIWREMILNSMGGSYQSLEELEEDLSSQGLKVVFMIDGLEEIFSQTVTSKTEKNAVVSLCRDMLNEIKIKYQNFGLMVFLRKDMARDAITINFEQFNSLYHSLELRWSSTEALRLAVWLVDQAVPDFYKEEAAIEMAPREVIDRTLHKLWGVKLGKPTSNEANSSRWILAALSDFNGQLQARDIIRFLEKSTVNMGKDIYHDRYLMPVEIKKAVSDCSVEKISEIRQEIKALEPILDKLENAPAEKKILPFHNDTFHLSQTEEKVMKQEGYLRVENDKYYLPEIIRHALKFRYERGSRPKVLSLLLKKGVD